MRAKLKKNYLDKIKEKNYLLSLKVYSFTFSNDFSSLLLGGIVIGCYSSLPSLLFAVRRKIL